MTSALAAEVDPRVEVVQSGATPVDKRVQRRVARHAQSRVEILDAAEQVFGEDGPRNGSLRRIAELSGFSPAGIYLFFENKQHLFSETLRRRGDEWVGLVEIVVEGDDDPMETLHRIVDLAVDFFSDYPHFRQLLRHIDRGATMPNSAGEVEGHYVDVVTRIGNVIRQGQKSGQIRAGGSRQLAHLYSVLVNEFVLPDTVGTGVDADALSIGQFHEFIDGAFRVSSKPRSTEL